MTKLQQLKVNQESRTTDGGFEFEICKLTRLLPSKPNDNRKKNWQNRQGEM